MVMSPHVIAEKSFFDQSPTVLRCKCCTYRAIIRIRSVTFLVWLTNGYMCSIYVNLRPDVKKSSFQCLLRLLHIWTFPPPLGGTLCMKSYYPLLFYLFLGLFRIPKEMEADWRCVGSRFEICDPSSSYEIFIMPHHFHAFINSRLLMGLESGECSNMTTRSNASTWLLKNSSGNQVWTTLTVNM